MLTKGVIPIPPAIKTEDGASSHSAKLFRGALIVVSSPRRNCS